MEETATVVVLAQDLRPGDVVGVSGALVVDNEDEGDGTVSVDFASAGYTAEPGTHVVEILDSNTPVTVRYPRPV